MKLTKELFAGFGIIIIKTILDLITIVLWFLMIVFFVIVKWPVRLLTIGIDNVTMWFYQYDEWHKDLCRKLK
jgi:hypothetical protein